MVQVLKRELNRTALIFYGVGSMIGAGIYSIIGTAAEDAGVHLWISFALASFAALVTVASYAELVSMYPKTGAEYQFLKKALPNYPILSFMAGYLIALNAAATSATVAISFASYLNYFVTVPIAISAFLLLAVCTVINISGIRQSTWFTIFLTSVEVAGLLIIIWSGIENGNMMKSFNEMPSFQNLSGIFSATALIFFIYIGFEDVANLSEETKDPTKTTPRALLISVLITSIIYILVAISYVGIGTNVSSWNASAPLSYVAGSIAPWRGQALAVAALFATASTALISLVSISRMLFSMGRGGDMPTILSKTLTNRQTPWVAAMVLFCAACIFLPLGKVEITASISSFGVLIVFISIHVALIILRYRHPDKQRPFRVPLSIGRLPIIPCVGIFMIIHLLTQFKWIVYIIGSVAILFGLTIYFFKNIKTW